MKKPFTVLAIAIFALVAIAHLLRLIYSWEVTFNGATIPVWLSIVGVVIAAGLAAGLWWESRN